MADDHKDSSLRSKYSDALAEKDRLGDLPPNSSDYIELRESALKRLQECHHLADALSVFSPNETLDDIATGDLPYLSVDFHLADLQTKTPGGASSPTRRREALGLAQGSYGDFLHRLFTYELLDSNSRKLLERWQADHDSFEVLGSGNADASARRGVKIQRYQQEKALKAKVPQRADASDDSAQRDAALAQLALQTHQTFDALDLVAAERRLLASAAATAPPAAPMPEADPRARSGAGNGYSDRLDPSLSSLLAGGNVRGPLLDTRGRPQQPFVLTDARAQARAGVFRSGHRLPTMSIDEYLEAERERGGIIEGGGEQSGIPKEVNEDDLEAADRETMKQREWDEFKEANPKGSGNTLNRG